MTIEHTAWTARLSRIPGWALKEELARRGEVADEDATVRLPGLVVDPVASLVRWRDEDYVLGGRRMEVLYALALAHQRGHRRMRVRALTTDVWQGWDDRVAAENLRTYVCYLRKRFPGLIAQRVKGTYELDLDAPVAAPAGRVA